MFLYEQIRSASSSCSLMRQWITMVSIMQGSGLIFTHTLQKWNCLGWKRWQLVRKQVSGGSLEPRVLVHKRAGCRRIVSRQYNGCRGTDASKQQGITGWWRKASTGGVEVVENDLKTFLSHKKYFLKPHQEFNLNSSVWSATFRITCSLRSLNFFTNYCEVIRKKDRYAFSNPD